MVVAAAVVVDSLDLQYIMEVDEVGIGSETIVGAVDCADP